MHFCMPKSLRQSLQSKRRFYCEMSDISIRFFCALMTEAHAPSSKGWTQSLSNGMSSLCRVRNHTVAPFLLNLFLEAHLLWKVWVSFLVSEIERHLVSLKPPVSVFHPFRLTLSAVVSMNDHRNIPPLGRGAPSSACGRRVRQYSCSCF